MATSPSNEFLSIDELRLLLMRWATYARGYVGPVGYPGYSAEQSAHIGYSDDGTWPYEVIMIEDGLVSLKLREDGVRRLKIIRIEYLGGYKPLSDKARALKIRTCDYMPYLHETERMLLDIVDRK